MVTSIECPVDTRIINDNHEFMSAMREELNVLNGYKALGPPILNEPIYIDSR